MSRGRAGAVAALVAAITLAYMLPLRDYGLNFEDEGLILTEIQRVADGQLPYVDFDTGYTPGYFYLTATLWRLAGDVPTLRAFLALMHAGTAAGLAVLAARVASPLLGVVVALLYVGFIPVFPGGGCMFNIPYPAWFATFAWVVMVLALVGFVERRGRSWLVAAALAAAAALATKPNAGVFALAATVAVVLLVETPVAAAGRASVAVWWLFWIGLLVGPWITLGGWPGLRDALAYLVPLTAALCALPTRARTHRAGLVGDVTIVVATFTVVSVPWLVFFWSRLGTERFLRDVLLIGSNAAQLYYLPYPSFEPWALLATAAVAAAAAAALGVRGRRLHPRLVAVAALVAAVAGVVAVARIGVMPESFTWSLIWQLESAGYPFVLLAHVAGVVWFWRRRTSRRCEVPAALLLCALFMHLQLFPRADFAHLVTAAALTAVFAAFLLEWVLGWWHHGLVDVRGGAPPRVARALVVTVAIAVLALRVSPIEAARFSAPGPALPFAVAPVHVERAESATLADLGAAATRLAALVPRGGPTVAFPAGDVALFLTGARNPSPISYFFPGRPDHREEAELVDVLTRTAPAALFTLNSAFFVFDDAPPYYFLLRRWARTRYALRERAGRFDVLAARGEPTPAVDATHVPEAASRVVPLRSEPLATAVPALIELASGDDANLRRAALTMLVDRLADEPDDALEDRIAAAQLDRRREILVLRTVRDTRDARAAGYLFAAGTRPDPRIANEALGAMFVARQQVIAGRYLWSGPEEPQAWPARAALVAAVRRTLADPGAPPRATALAAELAGVLGDAASAPLLRARLGADSATVASAASALARLAPAGIECELVALLGRPEPEIGVLLPSTVLDLAERDAATRACLVRVAAATGPAREPAIWIAAALGDDVFVPTFRGALVDGTPAVRRAAAWALGEAATDPVSGPVLARAAELDPDAIVRRFATVALGKQDGRAPRARLGAATVSGALPDTAGSS